MSIDHAKIHHLQETLAPLQSAIAMHPLIHAITTPEALRLLMSQHSFAVWDFVNLLKSLYSRLSSTALPWLPPQDPDAVRLLLEILLEEEADVNPAFKASHNTTPCHCSHFTLYRQAMLECGTSTTAIDSCLAALKKGSSISKALSHPDILPSTRCFVLLTFNACEHASLPALAANFVFGREAMVPNFFTPWLAQLKKHNISNTKKLHYYLSHHIQLDSGDHFPKAAALLIAICGKDPHAWQHAEQGARLALQARLDFFEGLYHRLHASAVTPRNKERQHA